MVLTGFYFPRCSAACHTVSESFDSTKAKHFESFLKLLLNDWSLRSKVSGPGPLIKFTLGKTHLNHADCSTCKVSNDLHRDFIIWKEKRMIHFSVI